MFFFHSIVLLVVHTVFLQLWLLMLNIQLRFWLIRFLHILLLYFDKKSKYSTWFFSFKKWFWARFCAFSGMRIFVICQTNRDKIWIRSEGWLLLRFNKCILQTQYYGEKALLENSQGKKVLKIHKLFANLCYCNSLDVFAVFSHSLDCTVF